MQTLNFKIQINAPKEKVWKTLWDDKTYRMWAGVFSPGSYAVTDWKEGSKTLFLGPEGEGMVSTIAKNIPNEFMSIKHLGMVKDGVEDLDSEETKKWSGALENYSLKEENGVTELSVSLDTVEDYKDYFDKTFPKALEKIKELSES